MRHLLVFTVVAALSLAAVPSCTLTPEQKAKVLEFTDGSLKLAVDAGVLKPGQSILIGTGVGLVTSLANVNAKPKEVPLTALGLNEVVADGTVKKGDTVIINEDAAIVISPPPPIALGERTSLLLPPPGG
jgi:hypothetical protein